MAECSRPTLWMMHPMRGVHPDLLCLGGGYLICLIAYDALVPAGVVCIFQMLVRVSDNGLACLVADSAIHRALSVGGRGAYRLPVAFFYPFVPGRMVGHVRGRWGINRSRARTWGWGGRGARARRIGTGA